MHSLVKHVSNVTDCDAFTTVEKRCRRHSVFGSVRPWVSAWVCASRKLCEHHISKNQWWECHTIFITDLFGFLDVLIKFWGQKVKGQGHSRRTHNRRRQPVEFHLVTFEFGITLTLYFQFQKFMCYKTTEAVFVGVLQRRKRWLSCSVWTVRICSRVWWRRRWKSELSTSPKDRAKTK